MSSKKIIFLDIDGVLNHQLWYEEIRGPGKTRETPSDDALDYFCPRSVDMLNGLTDRTGAEIVLSSSHRVGKSNEECIEYLRRGGITGKVLGRTPRLWFQSDMEGYNYSVPRGCEIKAWLETNKGILGAKMEEVRYVIFDDDSDMMYWQRENYFRVDAYCGLTPNIIYRAERFLNKK
jgi:hypothetical protein